MYLASVLIHINPSVVARQGKIGLFFVHSRAKTRFLFILVLQPLKHIHINSWLLNFGFFFLFFISIIFPDTFSYCTQVGTEEVAKPRGMQNSYLGGVHDLTDVMIKD